ncbi:hypothetical protein C8F01DRAFT_1362136 [Mycena amicta]|nr:hypothetical protein C8F01DRAFT_1362136 [Mycena amicta]
MVQTPPTAPSGPTANAPLPDYISAQLMSISRDILRQLAVMRQENRERDQREAERDQREAERDQREAARDLAIRKALEELAKLFCHEWHVLEEKIKLIRLASYPIDSLYRDPALALALLNFCIQDEQVDTEAGVTTPQELEKDAIETAKLESSNVVSENLSRSSTLKSPVAITLFASTPVREASIPRLAALESTASPSSPPTIFQPSSARPPLISHWSTIDVARNITDSVAHTFLFLRLSTRRSNSPLVSPAALSDSCGIARGIDSEILQVFKDTDSFLSPPLEGSS